MLKIKIAAYITLYQHREAFIECLTAIRAQTVPIDSIFIVDNSKEPIINDLDNNLISVHHFPENIGISQGITKALEWVLQNDYTFLWTFDQDSVPSPDCLEVLLSAHHDLTRHRNIEVGILAPTAYDKRSQSVIGGVNFINDKFIHCKHNINDDYIYECDAPITSGSLIDLKSAKSTEFPLIDLFIDGVDFDYGLKFKKQGFKNFIVTKAKLEHNYANPIIVKFLNFNWVFHSYSALRYYYSCRNTTYLTIHYAKKLYKFTASLHRIKTMFLKMIAITFFEKDKKIEKIYACLLGTYHGFIKKLGKTWQ
jgi:rhamnosyltransferase